MFSKTINPRVFLLTQDVLVHFLNRLLESNVFLEQPIVGSFVIDALRNKQAFSKPSTWKKLKVLKIYTTGYGEIFLG